MKGDNIAVIISDFQFEEISLEAKEEIELIHKRHEDIIFFVCAGAVPFSKNNPVDFISVKLMLNEAFPEIKVCKLEEKPDSVIWNKNLNDLIKGSNDCLTVTIYGDEKTLNRYSGPYPTKQLNFKTRLFNSVIINSSEFRKGITYATQKQYPKVCPTVDIAVIKGGMVLLGRKPDRDGYRFIGGFVDPEDESFEAAAIRETLEETGLNVSELRFLGTAKIDDWRYREEPDKIISTFFSAKYESGEPTPQDDISDLKWFEIASLKESDFVEEHVILFRLLCL